MGDTLVRALDGVDLTIERGEFVAITGASGSGKSTIMHLIGGLDRPTSGRSLRRSATSATCPTGSSPTCAARQIGFVFQTFNLINRITAARQRGRSAVLRARQYARAGLRAWSASGWRISPSPFKRTLRRRAACGNRKRAHRERPALAAGGRTDGQPRFAHRPADHGNLPRVEPARRNHRAGNARARSGH